MSDIQIKRTSTVFVALVETSTGEKPFLRYSINKEQGIMQLISTYTPPELRGRGIAEKLVEEAIKFAKENGLKIEPICSYAFYYFIKKKDKRDVLADWLRDKNDEELKKLYEYALAKEQSHI